MDNSKKTSLQEAMANFEEIKKFATKSAQKEIEKKLNEKLDKILKESISIDIDDNGDLTIEKDDKVVEIETNEEGNTEVEVEDKTTHEEEIDEIKPEENMDEMIQNEQEQNIPQEQPEATPVAPDQTEQSTMEEPIDEEPIDEEPIEMAEEPEEGENMLDSISQELADNILELVKTAIKNQGTDSGTQETEVVIDDEADATPEQTETAPMPEQPAPAPQPVQQEQPIQEEDEEFELDIEDNPDEEFELELDDNGEENEIFEISLSEIEGDDEEFELELDSNTDNSMENYDKEEKEQELLTDFELEGEEEIDEMKGKSKPLTQNQNSLSKLPRMEGKIKAQYESKLDGLKKENNSLNETVKELNETIKEYKDSFVELRKQFNEMQNFNAKLAYANKIFANGGLSIEEKTTIAEQFDKVKNADEALNLYNKIIKENKVSISENSQKIKSQPSKVVKAKNDTFYENKEMRRMKQIAGIEKNEELYS
jgi:uncharacterized protein YukE